MAQLGQYNRLTVLREASPGLYLDGGPLGDILLPGRYIPTGTVPGDQLDVFLYRDSEDRLVATTEKPFAIAGQYACLEVIGTDSNIGAFLDWGLPKDLLLPRREQTRPIHARQRIVVFVLLDKKSDRIVASMRLNKWLSSTPPKHEKNQPVKLLIYGETDLGYRAIVDHSYQGLLYHSELSSPLIIGQKLDGFVKAVRPDGKLDLSLDRSGFQRIPDLAEQIMKELREAGGHIQCDDNSPPEDIRALFGVSKKAFKQAIGTLYRQRMILIKDGAIHLPDA